MDTIAMWTGYATMAICTICGIAVATGYALNFLWRKILKDTPSLLYVQAAVRDYKTRVPTGSWDKK